MRATGENQFLVTGELTIKGVTRTVEIPVAYENSALSGSFELNRLDYGVGDDTFMVDDVVTVRFSVPVAPATAG